MARARTIKQGFFTNDELGHLDPRVHLLFAGLWTIADRDGRLLDRPEKIRADVAPYRRFNVDDGLRQLAEHGFIQRYVANGMACIQVVNWKKHQRPHPNEPATELPPPFPSDSVQTPETLPNESRMNHEQIASDSDLARARPGLRSPVSGPWSPVVGPLSPPPVELPRADALTRPPEPPEVAERLKRAPIPEQPARKTSGTDERTNGRSL